jgi:hypothetical protein
MNEVLNKIKDKKLRELINIYKESYNGFAILDILDYFYIRIRVDAIDAVKSKRLIIAN